MSNEKGSELVGSSEAPHQRENLTRVDWDLLKQRMESFLRKEAQLVATFLTLIALTAPGLIAHAQEFDETFCSLREVILEDARNTIITCTDSTGEQVELTLEFLITQYDVTTFSQEQVDHPPFFTSEYASDINNPNFNCHSRTLQFIEAASGVDFGASRATWLERGLDTFLGMFGDEITRMDAIPETFGEDVIDVSNVMPGDAVLFFDHEGTLIHSATVLGHAETEDGIQYVEIANKLGQSGELNTSIDDVVRMYDLWGEFDETVNGGGGSIVVYRPQFDRIREVFQNEDSTETSEPAQFRSSQNVPTE